ncbi:unnamed protein product [Mytilus coruscus]|uniref:Uncharacterized protein n=1 Tax=Mytilus coruscus TaxID=42192 RepID=A0A6J8BIG2_MYTCO|nr:unnamed protein product [Mytilus coruscus]
MFDPIDTEKEEILTSFAIAMRGILPNACIFRGLPKEDINEHHTEADEEIIEDHKETEDPTGTETNHSYYTQVQGQIAITGRKWCDLFIFTVNELLFPKLDSVEQLPEPMVVETSVCTTQTYFCPTCNNVIKESENVSNYSERSVGCDKCEL